MKTKYPSSPAALLEASSGNWFVIDQDEQVVFKGDKPLASIIFLAERIERAFRKLMRGYKETPLAAYSLREADILKKRYDESEGSRQYFSDALNFQSTLPAYGFPCPGHLCAQREGASWTLFDLRVGTILCKNLSYELAKAVVLAPQTLEFFLKFNDVYIDYELRIQIEAIFETCGILNLSHSSSET